QALPPIQHGRTGRVVTPVLQPLQSIQQDLSSRLTPCVTDNAAHKPAPRKPRVLETPLTPPDPRSCAGSSPPDHGAAGTSLCLPDRSGPLQDVLTTAAMSRGSPADDPRSPSSSPVPLNGSPEISRPQGRTPNRARP